MKKMLYLVAGAPMNTTFLAMSVQDRKLAFDDAALVTLAPVPEPESYAMLLAGLGLIGTIARRRKVSTTTAIGA